MQTSRWKRTVELFDVAIELPAAERGSFLERACPEDPTLRAEVESLIASAGDTTSKLQDVVDAEATRLTGALSRTAVGSRLGPYLLERVIGEGGMGVVYEASRIDAEFRRRVAIKVLRPGLASEATMARFRDERQILATLDHPHIVRLLDGGRTEQGLPYFIMEHVEGASIIEHARRHALSIRERVVLIHRVCGAVGHAHHQRVIHRDLKPSNILVDQTGAPKLLDFGIAKLLGDEAEREAITRTGALIFTPEYASPEQARGEPVELATDIYSLGAVLYQLLADRPPLQPTGNAAQIVAAISDHHPAPPSTWATEEARKTIAGDLDNIVGKALHKEARARYHSVDELAADLERYLGGRAVLARPPTLGYRAKKFVARNRRRLAALAIAGAAISIAGAATTVILVRSQATEVGCSGHDRVAELWAARRAGVREAMLSAGSPMAEDAWRTVERRLDLQTEAWTTMHEDACRARRSGEQSEALVDLRMRCLDQRATEVAALVNVLGTADAELVSRVSRGVQGLASIGDCADVELLGVRVPLPAEPLARARLDGARNALSAASALGVAGRYAQQLRELEPLLALARDLGYAPLIAEALFTRASALDRTSAFQPAVDAMRDASYAAEEGGDRKLAARARIELIWLVGHQLAQAERGLEYGREAAARLKGLGGDPVLEGLLESNVAAVLGDLGRHGEAEAHDRRALALREASLGPDDVQTAISRVNVGVRLTMAGKYRESRPLQQRSLESYGRTLGEHHPLYASTLLNLADIEHRIGERAAARAHAEQARRLIEAILGPNQSSIATADHVLALIAAAEGKLAESEVFARRAVALAETLRGPEHPFVALYQHTLGGTLVLEGKYREAVEVNERAATLFDKLGDHVSWASAKSNVGHSLVRLGQRREGLRMLETVLATLEADREATPVVLSPVRFALAEVLGDDPATLPRARSLAALALADANATERPHILAWQKNHAAP